MKKVLGIAALAVIAFMRFVDVSWPGPAHAQSPDAALSKTEASLQQAVKTTDTQALAVDQDLKRNAPSLQSDLAVFTQSSGHLRSLHEELATAITNYQIAHNARLADFNRELGSIIDPVTRHSIETMRAHLVEQSNNRLGSARAALDLLNDAIVQGSDLTHAAACVQIANELDTHAADLENQIAQARAAAETYKHTTTTLLARLTTAVNDTVAWNTTTVSITR